jgi:hypothetical protein
VTAILRDLKDGHIYWRMTHTFSPDEPEAEVEKYIAETNKYVEEEQSKDVAREAEED